MTSQYEDFHARTPAGPACSTSAPTRNTRTSWRGSICRRPCDMRAPGAATGVFALESAMDELAVALKLDPLELRLRCYSDRDQNEDMPFTSKALRECYRQGAEAFGWDKRNPRAALDARRQRAGRLGHGDRRLGSAAGADRGAHRADRQRPCRGVPARPPTSAPAPTRSWRRSRPTCSGCRSTTSRVKLGDSTLPQSPVEGGSWIAASVSNGDRDDGRRDPRRAAAAGARRCRTRRSPTPTPDDVALADGKLVSKQDATPRGVDRRCDAARRGGPHRAGEDRPTSTTTQTLCAATRIRRSSPR